MRKPQQSYFNSERGKCTSIARRGPHDADQTIAGNYPESARMDRRPRTDETESPKDLRHFGLHAAIELQPASKSALPRAERSHYSWMARMRERAASSRPNRSHLAKNRWTRPRSRIAGDDRLSGKSRLRILGTGQLGGIRRRHRRRRSQSSDHARGTAPGRHGETVAARRPRKRLRPADRSAAPAPRVDDFTTVPRSRPG
jgi:hypothetical protein